MHHPIRCLVRHRLPGRTRLAVAGPWPRHMAQVREALGAAGITLAAANRDTATLLLRHGPELDADVLAHGIGQMLAGGPMPPELQAAAPAPPPSVPLFPRNARIRATAAAAGPGPDAAFDALFPLTAEEVLARLGTTRQGLDAADVIRMRTRHGANLLPQPEGRSLKGILLEQVSTLPVALLLGSAVLSVATGGVFDAVVTVAVIAVNAGIGFATESSTERLIRRLSRPVEHAAPVLRAGMVEAVAARDVVMGDLLVLAPGTVVAADARLISASDLSLDESALTGESLPVEKTASPLPAAPGAVAERHNIVHSGTVVTGGDGLAVVVRTGISSEAARTRSLIGAARPPRSVTEEKLAELSTKLALGCIGASGLLLVTSLLRGEPAIAAVRSAIALAVAAIPEGLPAVATTTFALGARAMEKDHSLVRSLPAIEAIGAIDTVCLDKTGTLTRNEMAVVRVAAGERVLDFGGAPETGAGAADAAILALAEAVALCSEAQPAPRVGSSTELALIDFAADLGLDVAALREAQPLRAMRNRNHARRYMASEHAGPAGAGLYVKGSPEEVLELCTHELRGGIAVPLDAERRQAIGARNGEFAAGALRVLAAARGTGPLAEGAPQGLCFLGLCGLADPVKREAAEAIDLFHRAGIRTIILTGDQPGTAMAVAQSLALSRTGILRVASGPDIAHLDADALGELALRTSVFARVSPADKLRIVEALQAKGRRVAMLGDGVNDGPALRAASVGVAVGEKATSIAREVADLVLAHDDLRELARAIARGRSTQDNVRNAIRFFFSTNLSEILVMLAEELHGRGEGETPMELFWLNLVTDVLPGLGLALAEPRGDVMARPPIDASAPLFDRREASGMALDGTSIAVAALAGHFLMMGRLGPGPRTRAVTFTTLALAQIANAWVLRDRSPGAPEALLESERRLEGTLAGALGLLAVPFLVPGLRTLLGIAPATLGDVALSAGLAGASFAFSEARRIVRLPPPAGRTDGAIAP
ncbi:cation-translocating P-type ATPase [Xanthobacter sp. AM11]|uniref:cation-translocating P-type ATPase n=1 Tax=Xanthobacter sp. AM11 TaxID=3380643 RepID=UPI0039BF4AAD